MKLRDKYMLKYFLWGAVCYMAMTSCSKYLDVQPEDRFLTEQVFSTRQSAQNALNGIYLNIAKTGVYGASLSSTTVDVLAQYYSFTSGAAYYSLANYNYTESNARAHIETLWQSSYAAILNLNLFMKGIQDAPNLFSESEKNILMGEALGLRALIAFDLLRLFGPIYSTNPTGAAIPYPTNPKVSINSILPASAAIDSILLDLNSATELLQADPIRSEGVVGFTNDSPANFFKLRNRRMNYYATQLLSARVRLYRGDKQLALDIAKQTITESTKWFPWSSPTLSIPGNANIDRLFSSEIIMGVPNVNMYNVQSNYFSAALTTGILAPLPARLEGVYEGFLNDYRYRSWWEIDSYSPRVEKTFFKYADVANKSLTFRNLQPLMRMSELYYIVAECEEDEATAESFLNIVRQNRGLPNVTFNGNRTNYITKEYEKEFWGEGQLFYYYKRRNLPTIINGITGTGTVTMTPERYVLPLPMSETDYR